VDSDRGDAVRLTRGAYDPATIGVVSSKPGILMGGGAFSVEALRESWGDQVVAAFENMRPALLRRVLDESPELEARRERLQSVENYRQHLDDLARRDMPAVPRPPTLGRKEGAVVESRAWPDGVPSLSAEQVVEEYQQEKKDFDAFFEAALIQKFFQERFVAVALAGRVPVKVDASQVAVGIGDPLAASPAPGVAMVAREPGFIIGTALEHLAEGTGEVLALISRSWYGGRSSPRTSPQRAQEIDLEPSLLVPSSGLAADGVLHAEGDLFVRGNNSPGPLAEYHLVSEPVEPGEVVVVDRQLTDAVKLTAAAADAAVVGIVSGRPGVVVGGRLGALADLLPELAAAYEEARQRRDLDEQLRLWREMSRVYHSVHAPVALSGTVRANVDAGYGAIGVGELLTTSPTRGHLMRASEPTPGTIVAKALEPLAAGTGRIRVLVMLR
jgi:hypothetical protein